MKQLFVVLAMIVGTLCCQLTFAQPIAVTIYCDDRYPPHAYKENGEAKGIYTDILRQAFARMPEYQVTIEPVPWKRGLWYVEKGKGFALYPPYYRLQERPYMDYSVSILDEDVVIFVRAELMQLPRMRWVEDYIDLQIGVNFGFELINAEDRQQLQVMEVRDARVALINMGKRNLDAYVNDRISILWTLKQLKAAGEFDEQKFATLVQGATLSKEQGFLGVTNQDDGAFAFKEDFINQFNAIITEMKAKGEIQRIVV